MGLFDKFFGVVSPARGAFILAIFYTIVGFVFTILSFGRWIMPHAETDLFVPWAIVCLLLFVTGVFGVYATTKGTTWHNRQFVSFSWGFLLMFLCWAVVYIVVEKQRLGKDGDDCTEMCDEDRKKAGTIATALVTVGMVFGLYFTLVLSKWVGGLEWEEHLEKERRLDQWRSGHGENPNVKDVVVEVK
ncbi:hypothetical protein BGZ76_011129 [Entomortierella beljakovae]|nr:hypothetical protein BGZ76_011129 [Entomortierella beljakovae]